MGSVVLLDLMGRAWALLLWWPCTWFHSGIPARLSVPISVCFWRKRPLETIAFKALRKRVSRLTALVCRAATATALITSSFAAEGLVSLVPGPAGPSWLGRQCRGPTLIVFSKSCPSISPPQ